MESKTSHMGGHSDNGRSAEPTKPIAVIGTGYVGLVAGACFAAADNKVTCVDVDESRIETLRSGKIPFFEPGLDDLVKQGIESGNLQFSTDLDGSVSKAHLIFVTVGTPSREDGSADLSAVYKVAESVALAADSSATLVLKSTVPVGTADGVRAHVATVVSNPPNVIVNPEFLREGKAVEDFFYPDRVVIGEDEEGAGGSLKKVYEDIIGDRPIYMMTSRSAEMVKYISNCFLATKLSFINEMANVCDAVGADIEIVRHAVGMDSRIGTSYMAPGIGYGGSCLPKDLRALESVAREHGAELEILPAVQRVNTQQSKLMLEQLVEHFDGDVQGRRIAVWGLAFKPDTDDIREAPALSIIQNLTNMGASVSAYDPEAEDNASAVLTGDVEYNDNMYDALVNSDALVVATEWNHFKEADLSKMRGLMKSPVVFDGRNIYDPSVMNSLGLDYYCVGRSISPKVPSSEVALGD